MTGLSTAGRSRPEVAESRTKSANVRASELRPRPECHPDRPSADLEDDPLSAHINPGLDIRHLRAVHAHAHFECSDCGRVICLEEARVPAIALPPGFRRRRIEVTVKGTCDACKR